MTPAQASLVALLVAIILSCTTQINVGLVAIVLAWLVGVYGAGLSASDIAAGFPVQLFLTLAGVTLLFALSDVNGTIDTTTRRILRLARGSARLVPVLFFLIAMTVSTIGPGAVASVALVAPVAMALGRRAGVPPFLTALMVANGANAGNLSPLSSVGIIANTKMADVGLGGHEWKVWAANFLAHVVVAAAAWLLFGGRRLESRVQAGDETPRLTGRQQGTLAVIATWVGAVVLLGLNLGFAAFGAAIVLVLARLADETSAVRKMPWGAILMVCGVSLLVTVLEKTGGMELFSGLLARFATPWSVNGVMAFLTGVISTYSSTSGVVLPSFLPTVPGIIERVGGGDPLALALSINVGSSLVDVSPLSTIGALSVAALPNGDDSALLFRRLLIWGFSMTVAGAILSQMFAGRLAAL
ncbi:MAG: SLC13 family permease [Acidobacteriota bacterium]